MNALQKAKRHPLQSISSRFTEITWGRLCAVLSVCGGMYSRKIGTGNILNLRMQSLYNIYSNIQVLKFVSSLSISKNISVMYYIANLS